jgi:mRNA interferase YafQ
MYKLQFGGKYRKDLKRTNNRGKDISLLDTVVDKLRDGETLDEKHCDHLLKGEYEGWRECHIQPDWLLIYKINNDEETLTVFRTGTHSDLFE